MIGIKIALDVFEGEWSASSLLENIKNNSRESVTIGFKNEEDRANAYFGKDVKPNVAYLSNETDLLASYGIDKCYLLLEVVDEYLCLFNLYVYTNLELATLHLRTLIYSDLSPIELEIENFFTNLIGLEDEVEIKVSEQDFLEENRIVYRVLCRGMLIAEVNELNDEVVEIIKEFINEK